MSQLAQFNLSITLEYELAVATHRLQLVEEVRRWIADGWQPLGGPFVYEGDLCQAMVREKPKEPVDHTIIRRGDFTFKDMGGFYVKAK